MSTHALGVFDGAARVGAVEYESLEEQFSFTYDARWPASPSSYSISPHILMQGPPAATGTVRRFLENLLPEGRALDIVSTTHQVSKNNIYGLVRALGQETAGALSFLDGDTTPQMQTSSRREVSREELKRRIDDRAHVPFAVWDGRVRMSIAGYQDKLAIYREDEHLYLVEGELASTHILKPEPPAEARLPMLVANEHFCMSLAARLGLPVAPLSILRLPNPVLVVERFDRIPEHGRVRRLHMIDGCQALNLPVSYKYERNFGSGRDVREIRDGVSFERLFSVSDYTVRKALTRQLLLRWALFNYLVGNVDAHGKNVSFFCRADGLALAPFYDLVSVVQYEGLVHELAMAYGDEFLLPDVGAYGWADFAHRTATPRAVLAREMRRMGAAAAAAAAAQAIDAVYAGEENEFVRRISAFVGEQAKKLIGMAGPMTKVDATLL
ncbi:MAG: HipA domain-containing protein [Pseudomonadota bacterium]